MQEIVKPATADLRIRGASIREPVLVDLLTGAIYGVKARAEGGVMIVEGAPLADYPMTIVSKQIMKNSS